MDEFEVLLQSEQAAIERFVRFKIPSREDADDVLQETYLSAFRSFAQLTDHGAFKAWMIRIAQNKCNDYFRRKASQWEIPIDDLSEATLTMGRQGLTADSVVRDTLELLGKKDKQILYLFYWKELPQGEIAKQLDVPVGTVKSRLYKAKQNFKTKYPYRPDAVKGEHNMKKMPAMMPSYQIKMHDEAPFSVKWEELMGWFLVPKLGEKLTWGMYETPSGKCSHIYDMRVTGKAKVHGVEGVELTAREAPYSGRKEVIDRTFVAQLTDTHCRYLATLRNDGDVHHYITFLDADEFMPNWGFGENNCGNEINLTAKGEIVRNGSDITTADKDFLLDIVGRYDVTINGKTYDTVCVMDIETYNSGVVSEQYLDHNGRTILWRRFNRNDWAIDQYGKKWSEQMPDNEQITVNGSTYVHWYDCITDYVIA